MKCPICDKPISLSDEVIRINKRMRWKDNFPRSYIPVLRTIYDGLSQEVTVHKKCYEKIKGGRV